jgi:uncharacterized LabA/DUF88 family protein
LERTAVFIDAGFVDKVALHHDIRFDYTKLASVAAGDGKLIRAFYYFCMPYRSGTPTPDEERRYHAYQQFMHFLTRLDRFELRQGHLAYRGVDVTTNEPIFEQKGVDVMLALDLVRMASSHQFQRAVLLTSDSDFVPAIKMAKDQGLEVILYYEPGYAHPELLHCCDVAKPIDGAFIAATHRTAPRISSPPHDEKPAVAFQESQPIEG